MFFAFITRQLLVYNAVCSKGDLKVFVGTSDAHLVALDIRSGRPVWNVEVADARQGFRYTAGPLAGDGRVFASLSCSG